MVAYKRVCQSGHVGGWGIHKVRLKLRTVEPVYNGHPWDHAKWLLYRGGLLIEVGDALELY